MLSCVVQKMETNETTKKRSQPKKMQSYAVLCSSAFSSSLQRDPMCRMRHDKISQSACALPLHACAKWRGTLRLLDCSWGVHSCYKQMHAGKNGSVYHKVLLRTRINGSVGQSTSVSLSRKSLLISRRKMLHGVNPLRPHV